MALKTTLVQLEEVQAAITSVMSGQSGTWGDKTVTMADLSSLNIRESMLLKRYKQENGTGGLKINQGITKRD
jgi:hypothetical protein